MPNEPIDGVKFSEFPSYIPGSSDELVGLHNGNNARFSVSNFILSIRQGLSNLFVPQSRTINGKGLSSDISLTAQDVGARSNTWTPSAADVGAQDTITASGILKGDGAGGVSAATPGTDYQAPLTAGTDYATPAQLADKAAKADLTSIQATGTTNTTGAAIPAGAYFYLNGVLYRAKTQIDVNATFTVNTNCEQVPDGGFNSLKAQTLVRRQSIATSITTGLNEWDVAADAVLGYKPIGLVGVQFAALPRSAVTLSQFFLDNGTNVVVAAQSTQARTSGIAVNAFVLYAKK